MEEMEEEGSVAPGAYRNSMMSKVRSYRRELDKLKRDLVSTCFKINVLIQSTLKNILGVLSPGQTDSQVDAIFGLAFNLHFIWPPTCIDLQRLAWSCVDFGRAQIWTQVDASFLSFGHPAQDDTS